MILNEDVLTAQGADVSIQFFVKDKTLVHIGGNKEGDTVIRMGPVTLFFTGDTDMELVNLILSHRKSQGKSYI